jgi:hypothetical protein
MSRKSKGFSKTVVIPPDKVAMTSIHFRHTGFIDYAGARVMLSNGLFLQGVVLTSTCIEKYLKAIFATVGKRMNSHLDDKNLLSEMKSNGVDVTSYISHSFLKYLGKAYKFRYIEPGTGPVSIAVEQRKLLAELDYSVSQFETALTATHKDGSPWHSQYERAVAAKDQTVWMNNYVLNDIDKVEFVEQPAYLYGAFAAPMQEFAEMTNSDFKSTNNALFEYPTVTAYGTRVTFEFGENIEGRDMTDLKSWKVVS